MEPAVQNTDVERPLLSGDAPIRISHSQLASWSRCRFQWWLGYVEKWKPKKVKEALEVGSLGHDWLRKHYLGTLDLPAELEKISYVAHGPEYGENSIQAVALAANIVRKYIEDYAPVADKDITVLEVEKHFEIPMVTPWGTRFILEGYVDLIVREHGRLWVWDHKFTSRLWSPIQVMMDSQTPTYAAALRHLGLDVFGLIINQCNTYPYKHFIDVPPEKLFKREESHRTPEEMDTFLMELYKQVEDIKLNRDKIRRTLNKDCAYCFFQEPCQLNLKGIPIGAVMDDFEKKGGR